MVTTTDALKAEEKNTQDSGDDDDATVMLFKLVNGDEVVSTARKVDDNLYRLSNPFKLNLMPPQKQNDQIGMFLTPWLLFGNPDLKELDFDKSHFMVVNVPNVNVTKNYLNAVHEMYNPKPAPQLVLPEKPKLVIN